MNSSGHGVKSVADFFNTVVDHVFGALPAPVMERRTQNLAQKRMNIRAVGVREGFQAMRARSEEMAHRVEAFKQQRHPHASVPPASIDPVEDVETIVLSSSSLRNNADNSAT